MSLASLLFIIPDTDLIHRSSEIPSDGEALDQVFNKELAALAEAGKNTWFTAPWLFAESVFNSHLKWLMP